MTEDRPHEPKLSRRIWPSRFLLILAVVASLLLGVTWNKQRSAAALEASAKEFIRLNGSTNEGYRHNIVSTILSVFPFNSNGRPIASHPIPGVVFPQERMNDYMANELLNIRNLESIVLYPPDPHREGFKYGAKSVIQVPSLRNLDLQLSENSIRALEERFPRLTIHVVQQANSKTDSDVTK